MDPKKRSRILEKIKNGRATRAERLLLKQEGLCLYCWTDLERDITKEHLHARAEGGSNDRTNLRVAHMPCNGIVGSLPVALKLELHEIGREKGPEAFWAKAREYQQRYGNEKRAYSRKGTGSLTKLKNANRHPAVEETHSLTVADAQLEMDKLSLANSGTLSKSDKLRLLEEREILTKDPAWPGQITWREFFQALDRYGVAGVVALRQRAA